MAFCPNCGTPLDNITPVVPQEPTEVVLARIEADRAIQVARIEAGAARAELRSNEAIAETQAEAEVESAVAVAEIITAEDEAEETEEPEPEPVIIDAPAPEPEPDNAPPEVEHREPRQKASNGWWANYR